MASLEDKILGEKQHNYCSSSEDEEPGDEDRCSGDEEGNLPSTSKQPAEPPQINKWSGISSNTGPKGVLDDWRAYKQYTKECYEDIKLKRLELAKRLTMTVQSEREEELSKKKDEVTDELCELEDEEFLMKYQQKRMQELLRQVHIFGSVQTLNTAEQFLQSIDETNPRVTVIIHIFRLGLKACECMDGCLVVLAKQYPATKFCRVNITVTGLSKHFGTRGLPALLAYKNGEMIGNYVQVLCEKGDQFFAKDVETLLVSEGMLPTL